MTAVPKDILALGEKLADIAREIARRHFRTTTGFERKADRSPVTIADRAIEAAMRDQIARTFPDHAILGEEGGFSSGQGGTWVLDPIDGTQGFVTGVPLFGSLIAHIIDGVPVLGICEVPILGERWTAFDGVTRLDGVLCHASSCDRLGDARVFATTPDLFTPDEWDRFDRISRQCALRRYGSDCYQYAMLASGHCDLVIESLLRPYDFMALAAVVEGAGGVMTDWEGHSLRLDSGPRVVASASPALHARVLEQLREG